MRAPRRDGSDAAPPHQREPLVEEVAEVRDAEEPVFYRGCARLLALAGEAHRGAPFLGLEVAAADEDQSDEVRALVVVEARDRVAQLERT